MTLGEFWGHVQTLVQVFDGRVTSAHRSPYHNRQVGGVSNSYHVLGLAADVVLRDWSDKKPFVAAAERLLILVIDETKKKGYVHLQPK